ncbi:MAG: hypothetical protein KC964_14330 [Candidatus Omnitrophica bacterium]|nr:hypothetical protein [Candidatus Omnitrophota bacterium]MCA9441980.1 hypothetical protein [Candidatus Omnitrophota bacterium]
MLKKSTLLLVLAIPLTGLIGPAMAEEEPFTLAVLNFDCREKSLTDTADLVRQLVEVHLSGNGEFVTVARDDLDKILEEQKRGLSGISETAIPAVGKLLGAGAMVTGSVFKVHDTTYATAKIFSTETGRSFAVKAKGAAGEVDTIAESLGDQIGEIVAQNKTEFRSPVAITGGQLNELKEKLADRELPVVFVSFNEQTVGTPVIDPAIQTEFEYILRQCGFHVVKDSAGDLQKWISEYRRGDGNSAPPRVSNVDLVIHGEGISEFATRNADLVSFRSRVEMEVLDVKTGKVVLADRETVTSVDLSSHIAAKSALQKAAAILAHRTLADVVEKWNAKGL